MSHFFEINSRATLISFNRTHHAPNIVSPTENYWQLIGEHGTVVECTPPSNIAKNRVLFKFDRSLRELELASHNAKENSLWIDVQDLKLL
jgi:hypothetical protein